MPRAALSSASTPEPPELNLATSTTTGHDSRSLSFLRSPLSVVAMAAVPSPAEVEAAMLQMLVNNTAIMKDGEAKLKAFLKIPAIVGVLLQLIDGSANPAV